MNIQTAIDVSMQVTKALEIARANANAAWDQMMEYEDSVSSYAQNVRDTLKEEGLREHTQKALAAYYLRVAELFAE